MRLKLLTLLCFLIFSIWTSNGQEVQWASDVDDFSSQYGTSDYSAKQVLGVPNAMTGKNLSHMAWVPKKENNAVPEFIKVSFRNAAQIQQVAVAESKNPGSIYRITLYDTKGNKHKIYENKLPRKAVNPYRLFKYTFPKTNYKVKSVKIELKTKAVPGSNQIDAIAISSSRAPIKLKINKVEYNGLVAKPERLSNNVNSNFAERLPIISPDGHTLYFARKYHPQNMGEENNDDIWVSYRELDRSWSRASNIGAPLNNTDHNFVVAMNPAGNILYLANDYRSRNKDGLSVTKKEGRLWSRPKTLKIEDHYNENKFVSYHVSPDGEIILMSVERKSGFGDRDLYVSFKTSNNSYSKPQNLGGKINTVGVESSVFLAADGKTIYFSSNGHEGYGGLDMFMSKRLDDTWRNWSPPKNLGPKINTEGNEYNYTIPASGDYAYFAVDEANSMSALYRIRLPEEVRPDPVMLFSGRIINAETKRPISANLKYQNLNSSKNGKVAQSDGSFQIVLPYGENVGIYAETEGYISVSESMALAGKDPEELDYEDTDLLADSQNSINPEIEELRLRLEDVNKDLEYLDVKRQRASQKNKTQQKRTGIRTSDPELEALKHKFNSAQRDKADTKEKSNRPVTSSSTSSEDRELQAMKERFNKHNQKTDNKDIPQQRQTSPEKKQKDDDELAEMRRRYNKAFGVKTEEEEKPVQQQNTNSNEVPEFEGVDDDFDFELFSSLVHEEMEGELETMTKLELLDENYDGVIRDMERSSSYKNAPAITNLLKNRVKRQLLENYENASTYSPSLELRKMKQEYKDRDVAALEKNIRRTIKPRIEESMRNLYMEDVLLDIESEMAFTLKSIQEKEIRKELEEKIDDQQTQTTQPSRPRVRQKEEPIELTPEYKELEKDILMVPIKVGQTIPMNNLFFDSNKSSLKGESITELARITKFLRNNPNLVVEVGGHTNGWCSHTFANDLSTDRSKVVAEYFYEQGISENKVLYKGYGKTNPIASNDTIKGRKENQRVELKILEILR